MQKIKLNIQRFGSGIIDGSSTGSNCDCRLLWSSTKNDNDNSSLVEITAQIKKSGSSSTTGTFSGDNIIDGTDFSVSKKATWAWGDWRTVATSSKTVKHNDDGTKQVNVSTLLTQTGTTMAGTYRASGTITLDTINRASKLQTINNFGLNDTVTIGINKYVTSAVDTLQIKVGDTLIRDVTNIANGYELTFSDTEKATINSLSTSPQVPLIFLLTTVNDGTTLGTSTQSASVTLLDKPMFREIYQKESGKYQVAINGFVNTDVDEVLQVYDDNGKDTLFYQPGDTFENSYYMPLSGHITSATQYVSLTLVVPKRLDNITTITCNKFNCEARGLKGYLNSKAGYVNYVNQSGYTIECYKATNNSVLIQIKKSSAWTNVDNNTPVTFAIGETIGDLKLTFN